jgi:hypothetical protein
MAHPMARARLVLFCDANGAADDGAADDGAAEDGAADDGAADDGAADDGTADDGAANLCGFRCSRVWHDGALRDEQALDVARP